MIGNLEVMDMSIRFMVIMDSQAHTYPQTHQVVYLKYTQFLYVHRKENHGLGEETCGCQGGRGGSGRDWEPGVNRCRMLPSGWISDRILLRSTGNSV